MLCWSISGPLVKLRLRPWIDVASYSNQVPRVQVFRNAIRLAEQ